MSCLDENQVLQYVEGLYDEGEARAIEAHLSECAECRFLLAAAGGAALENSPSTAPTQDQQGGTDDLLAPGASAPKIGEIFQDTYVVERFIGAGGMGAVYEVSHQRLARRFAIKFITEARATDEEAVARMQREAYVTSRLSHPNIIQVTDFNYADDGAPFIVMELLTGESLAEFLTRQGAVIDMGLVGSIARQVSSALQAAHDEGIVHRDLTPGNIFLCHAERDEPLVKVMDFGLSKIVERSRHRASSDPDLTRVISVLGSPHFMSPEQATGRSANVDYRADIFSFGAILYRMLVGRPPFTGGDIDEVMRQVAFARPAPTPEWLRIPGRLRAVIERALHKEAALRQHSMAELWEELEIALKSNDPQATHRDKPKSDEPPTVRARAKSNDPRATVRAKAKSSDPRFMRADERSKPQAPIRARPKSDEPPTVRAKARSADPAIIELTSADVEVQPEPKVMPAASSTPVHPRRIPLYPFVLLIIGVVIALVIAFLPTGGGRKPLAVKIAVTDGSVGVALGGKNSAPLPASSDAAIRRSTPPDSATPDRTKRVWRRPSPAGYGAISVQTVDERDGKPLWAHLYLDRRKVGQTALTIKRVRSGRHWIEVRRAGYRSVRRKVRVKPGRRERLQLPMRRDR